MVPKAADFSPRVERLLHSFGREVTGAASRKLVERAARFAELVVSWNDRVDLTSVRDPDELVDLLFADAAAMSSEGERVAGESWLDVGSGLGAPGVALALLNPRVAMTLVEPRARRVAFLRTLLHHLERPDVRVERMRSEALGAGITEVAVSRATFPPEEWLLEGARLARRQVWVLVAKGRAPEPPPGLSLLRNVEFEWPLTHKRRKAICYGALP